MSKAKDYNSSKREVVGIEIGVDQGVHAWEILSQWKEVKTLFLIDNYSARNISHYGDARTKLESFKDRIVWHILSSYEASKLFDDNSLDFAYIDASHGYEDVIRDCVLWWPKIKNDGIMCGHDYRLDWHNMTKASQSWKNAHGVVRAVNEFSKIKNLELGTKTDGSSSDWWINK